MRMQIVVTLDTERNEPIKEQRRIAAMCREHFCRALLNPPIEGAIYVHPILDRRIINKKSEKPPSEPSKVWFHKVYPKH
jgi:hypothetical protein